jgi:hypothetical protein
VKTHHGIASPATSCHTKDHLKAALYRKSLARNHKIGSPVFRTETPIQIQINRPGCKGFYKVTLVSLFIGVPIFTLILALFLFPLFQKKPTRDGNWHEHTPLGRGPIMRRFVENRWEERSLSEAEMENYHSRNAW